MTKTYAKKMPKKAYEKELKRLQAELVTMQRWVNDSGARVLVIFEGRDAAGKGGTIKRVTQCRVRGHSSHMSPDIVHSLEGCTRTASS